MLTEYIQKAMSKAAYEKFEDGTYGGQIPECLGTIAFGTTLHECQVELQVALEGWILVKIRHGDSLPVIEGINLNIGMPRTKEAVSRG